MQVRVFESTDMASGLKRVRQELGPDALILSTRTIKNGKRGLSGKQILEITAAIDSPWPTLKHEATTDDKNHRLEEIPYHRKIAPTISTNRELPFVADTIGTPLPEKIEAHNNVIETPSCQDKNSIHHEVNELKSLVKTLAGDISRIRSSSSQQEFSNTVARALEEKLHFSKNSHDIEKALGNQGISSETARTLYAFASDRLDPGELNDQHKLCSFLRTTIADLLKVAPPSYSRDGSQKRIALVGPTGVGKTTTLAKIAARYLGTTSHSLALITIDTYRIAAVEQLKVYGEIMHLPVDVVISPQQLEKALEKHRDKDLILIDTAGRNPRDTLSIDELHSFLQPSLAIENHLVLSSTTRERELIETINTFSSLGITNTIFTKTDECSTLGVLLNVNILNNYPLSYITNGQRVPEDLAEADPHAIAKLIIPSPYGKENDR